MIKDPRKEYREEMQGVMLELYIKTDKFLKKLKEQSRRTKFNFGNRQ